jgi:hypothetical protein
VRRVWCGCDVSPEPRAVLPSSSDISLNPLDKVRHSSAALRCCSSSFSTAAAERRAGWARRLTRSRWLPSSDTVQLGELLLFALERCDHLVGM